MIEFFRKNLFFNTLLIIPYLLVVRIGTFIYPARSYYIYQGENVFIRWVYDVVSNPFLQSVAAGIFIFINVILINRISIRHRLGREYTLFGGIVYIILMSLTPSLAGFHPTLLANTFLLVVLINLFRLYKAPYPAIFNFNTGFFIALTIILYPPYLFFILFGLVGIMVMGSFQWKEQMQYLSGLVTGFYLFYGLIYYFSDNAVSTFTQLTSDLGIVNFSKLELNELIALVFYAIIFVFVFFSYNKYGLKKSIQVQKKIDVLFWCMAFTALGTSFYDRMNLSALTMIAPAMAILLGVNMSGFRNKIMMELLHLICLGVLYFSFFFLPRFM